MLYPKTKESTLSKELFENPTSEYRGAPFWAWNCKLEREELLRQIDVLREMGFGGFHMHVRSGLDSEYLGEEFMSLIADCTEKAKKEKMLSYLYDEDRWPSGFAGGFVTKNKKYRKRYLLFTPTPYGENEENAAGGEMDLHVGRRGGQDPELIGRYDIVLDENGCLASYRRLADGESATGSEWFAYSEAQRANSRYNGETYVDTLSKEALECFADITYEAYRKKVGGEFGKAVPAIFTDEPQFSFKQSLRFAKGGQDATGPWTSDFDESFQKAYGYSLLDKLPEVFFELPNGEISQTRYFYHDHSTERFVEAFADTLGAWCDKNGILFTGHMMDEPTLAGQNRSIGEAMRSYRSFSLPGIDMLSSRFEYTTAKQAQSAVHQKGDEGMMSELYGVTTWDFDFRGHKVYGDWQAALGVSLRVPHLAWVSMEGQAKRDYPASISYQSPWYKEYRYIEDHFARVNTALLRGRPVVRVGVIHPIESFWLHYGPADQTGALRKTLDQRFQDLTKWLLFGGMDFDFICESTLPLYCEKGDAPFTVGKMQYDVIVVPACETLRSTTVKRLQQFRQSGGRVIFMDAPPRYVDAVKSDKGSELARGGEVIPYDGNALLQALESVREVELRDVRSGLLCDNLLYALREDTDCRWLFVAHGKPSPNPDLATTDHVLIKVRGSYTATLYDTLTGKTMPLSAYKEGEYTVIERRLYQHDSLLVRLERGEPQMLAAVTKEQRKRLDAPAAVPFTLGEPNVLVLDMAKWSVNGGAEQPREEILRVDTAVRNAIGYKPWGGSTAQPWVMKIAPPAHKVHLVYEFESEIAVEQALLGVECPEGMQITFNGKAVDPTPTGYYVDRSIKTLVLPPVQKGRNVLEIEKLYGERSTLESVYILGSFGVRVAGSIAKIVALPERLAFADITRQDLGFYSGKLTYRLEVETKGGDLAVTVPRFRASVLRISADGKSVPVSFSPYTARFALPAGKHCVEIAAYIPRTNGFAPLHNCDETCAYQNPAAWRTEGDKWSYEYCLTREGLLAAPLLEEITKE